MTPNNSARSIESIAEDYLLAGLSVIPVDKDKRATCKWETFQKIPLALCECNRVFSSAWGLAVISGAVSGGLEVIDFDAHNNDINTIYNQFGSDDAVKYILGKYNIPVERSPHGGYHLIYRYESDRFEGNQKLANWEDGNSMIESRGDGGYTVVFPSPDYTLLKGSLGSIPIISLDERDCLIKSAKTFNRSTFTRHSENVKPDKGFDNTDPVSYFNWQCSAYAKKLLEDRGWVRIKNDSREGIEYWKRPGKEGNEHSATWGKKHNSLYVFSSSAAPFEHECYYTPFQILVKLRFHNAFNSAISWIQQKYFDEQIPYIRIGIDYFKKIKKVDRFGIVRVELKPWKKDEIKQDHGKLMVDNIPRFDDFTIAPDNISYNPIINNCYNLYRAFPHQPLEGEWYWTDVLIKHIFGDQYFLGIRYLQILYLHPTRLMPILVMVSRERQTGKTTFLNWLNMVFGDNMANITPDDLVNGFNSTYASSNIIAVEETLIEKTITVEKLKALATQKFISVNQKFVSQYRMPFFGKIILTSNNEDKFARIDEEEIRFFIRKVNTPSIENHNIESDMVHEIPAFLHYLTTLPSVDFSHDRSGFTPAELANDSLIDVKKESKSGLYKAIQVLFEDLFMNELSNKDEFYADIKSIKQRFFDRDSKVDIAYLRHAIKNEFYLLPSTESIYFNPFATEPPKTGRPVFSLAPT
jgi:hypothetical protein